MHHIRTLRIMSEVYSKGLQKELQLELQTVERLFPALDELLDLHTQHLLRLLERKRESQLEAGSLDGGIVISRIGDLLLSQVRAVVNNDTREVGLGLGKGVWSCLGNCQCVYLEHESLAGSGRVFRHTRVLTLLRWCSSLI